MEVKLLIPSHHTRWCNCYGIRTEKTAIIIDPGKFTEELSDFLMSAESRVILITHAHYDHMLGMEELRNVTGAKIYCDERNFSKIAGHIIMPPIKFYGDKYFDVVPDGSFVSDCELSFGDITVKAIHTPGHHIGSVSYLIGDNLFSGDTLFFETVGVTKYPTGSADDMRYSVNCLKCLDSAVKVFPGHGRSTDIAHELKFNPFMK